MSDKIVRADSNSSNITIQDVADALGISKTTVSRAISGKGRIGAETKSKVLAYIEEYGYRPNPIAKSLADQKSYNIAWVVPGDSSITDLPFFQKCMSGVIKTAEEAGYDVIISMVYENDNDSLKRLILNNKIDGVVLGRTLKNDINVKLLKAADFPFVCIGTTEQNGVIQIDNDHINACCELTTMLIMKGIRNFVYIGGSDKHVVNETRKLGFEKAVKKHYAKGYNINTAVYMNADDAQSIDRILDNEMKNSAECIITADDKICRMVLDKLRNDRILVPDDIRVASFYQSEIISGNQPAISTLKYEPEDLGAVATRVLLSYLQGEEVSEKTLLSYDILLKESTN